MPTNDDVMDLVRQDRETMTASVIYKIDELVGALNDLRSEMAADPGAGIGLQYARSWRLMDEAAEALRRYQNEPLERHGAAVSG